MIQELIEELQAIDQESLNDEQDSEAMHKKVIWKKRIVKIV